MVSQLLGHGNGKQRTNWDAGHSFPIPKFRFSSFLGI
jgi:hypothetical protein